MNIKHQRGYALLVTAVIIILGIAITALVTARTLYFNQKAQTNEYNQQLAFQAAEAGLEFGIGYLYANRTTVVNDANNNGFIDGFTNSSVTNVALPNGSTYNIIYSNPVLGNFDTIQISSTGTADNGNVTRTITQLMQIYPLMPSTPPAAVIGKNSVSLSGNVSVNNVITNTAGTTIWSGGAVTLSGSSQTESVNGVSSDRNALNSDVVHNDTGISALTNDQFFSGFFGQSKTQVQQNSDIVYNNSSNFNLSSALDGVTGKSIWVNQTAGSANLSSNATIGSADHPVVLVVNGPFSASGTVTVYGVIYVIGDWINNGGGTLTVNGAMVVEGAWQSTGTPNVNFSTTILSKLSGIGEYVKVPGSWKDF